MGIEPFLMVGIVVAMFLVQVVRAAHVAITDRLEYALLTMDGAGRHASRRAMAPEPLPQQGLAEMPQLPGPAWLVAPDATPGLQRMDPTARSWSELRSNGLLVRLIAARSPAPVRRAVYVATGVRQRRLHEHLKWLAPSILVVVTLPRPVVSKLRISPRRQVVTDAQRLPLRSPVLDQLLRVTAEEPGRICTMLADPRLHEPLIEVMAMHPLSVVTGRVVALWCAQAVHDPEPLVKLAVEVAEALETVAAATEQG